VDVETLLAKLGTFVRARHEIDTVRSKALFDRLTGLYTEYGLQHWVEQLGARALRKREPIACVVVAPDVSVSEGSALTAEQSSEALAEITDVCRAHARRSDILGYLGDSRVAILAPDTDVAGVQRLIDRLQQAIGQGASKSRTGHKAASLRAGYCAVSNLAAANLTPSELVRRAETALAYAPRGGFDSSAVNFDEMLPS
jgi:GGDEF domain-containing protein